MRLTINDDEEVDVDDEAGDNFYISDTSAVNDSAFKCGDCKKVTVHSGIEVEIDAILNTESNAVKHRYYVCTNCGKFGKK